MDWDIISPITRNAFVELTDEKLEIQIEMGGMKMSFFDMVVLLFAGKLIAWGKLLCGAGC